MRRQLWSSTIDSKGQRTVRVVDDDGVGRLQVETETASSSREQEELVRRIGIVVLPHRLSSIFLGDRTIESKVGDSSPAKIVLHDVLYGISFRFLR